MDTLRPLFDRLVVKEVEKGEDVTEKGIVLPATRVDARLIPHQGIILAVGPGLDWWPQHDIKMPVHVGDKVTFPPQAGYYVEVNEERLLVVRVGDLLGVIEDAYTNEPT